MKYALHDIFKTSWSELTPAEMIRVIDLSAQLGYHPESREYGLTAIAILRCLRKNKGVVAKINVEQAVDCFNDITFFRRTARGFMQPWYFFPVGNFSISGTDFVRPESRGDLPMANRIFDQLVYADTAFSNFCVHQRDEELAGQCIDALIAVLYTDPASFDILTIDARAALVPKKLSTPQRALILHTYANVRGYILDRCPYLFRKPPEDQADESVPEPPVSTGEMWLNLRFDLAETPVFQGFAVARRAMLYDALDLLEKKAREATEQKSNLKDYANN